MIAVVFMAFTFFVLIFSVYMYMRTKKVEFGLFALLCICVLGYGSYPILHAFVAVKVQPCYGMEALFYCRCGRSSRSDGFCGRNAVQQSPVCNRAVSDL